MVMMIAVMTMIVIMMKMMTIMMNMIIMMMMMSMNMIIMMITMIIIMMKTVIYIYSMLSLINPSTATPQSQFGTRSKHCYGELLFYHSIEEGCDIFLCVFCMRNTA
jgi:hypothetical protein